MNNLRDLKIELLEVDDYNEILAKNQIITFRKYP